MALMERISANWAEKMLGFSNLELGWVTDAVQDVHHSFFRTQSKTTHLLTQVYQRVPQSLDFWKPGRCEIIIVERVWGQALGRSIKNLRLYQYLLGKFCQSAHVRRCSLLIT
jgi:hypothetical protein